MSRTDDEIEDLPIDFEYVEGEGEFEGIEGEQAIVYNSEDFISGPHFSENSTLPENILEFHYSYGYDCKRYFNLVVADEETVIFASGNFINFFNVNTRDIWFRRSALGEGIGHITKNPIAEFPHIAIAENGNFPPIIIYEWPSLDIISVLKGGTSRIFMHLNYSPDGLLLVSQGGEPDHLITVWDWPKSKILLRTKSYVSDVFTVKFSPYVPGHIATSGLSHIKFWKMANTFTGLKLQGELGRFGKTEYSDILGVYGMPDEKVISGSLWGNILIWEAGLIKIEVFRTLRKKCHDGPIIHFDYRNGELWTVAMDGRVRVWTYDVIDQADPPDDDRIIQIEPIYDFHTPGVEFLCISKQKDDPTDTFYLTQDGNGGIWRIDLTTEIEVQPSVQLFKCHSGSVVDIAACPWANYLASLGDDGRLHLYNFLTTKLIFQHKFPAKGRAMIWLPMNIQPSGDVILMGFDDGNVRVIVLDIDEDDQKASLTLIQITKPHNRPLTALSINKKGNVLVTGGEDKTIFVFCLTNEKNSFACLIPIGYIFVPEMVTCLTWHIEKDHTILVGCNQGHIVQVSVPEKPQNYTTITYILKLEPKYQRFQTYKAQILRDIKIKEIETRKAIKREQKRKEMEKIIADNPGLEVDEEVFLADSESDEELEPLFIPEIPNKILWMQSTPEKTIWLSMGGYDAGYIYEYEIGQKIDIPVKFRKICDGDDIEISSYVYSPNKKYIILAMQHGEIRVVKINPHDFRDLSDYWQISMHDNLNGFIPKMCFSYDEKLLFSCGHDGNIFSYLYNPEDGENATTIPMKSKSPKPVKTAEEISDYSALSLEEEIVKAEIDRKERLANDRKNAVLSELKILREKFEELLERNKNLLPSQIIPREELEIDPRIKEDLQEILNAEMALEKRKLAYQVKKSEVAMQKLKQYYTDPLDVFPLTLAGIEKDISLHTIRQRRLDEIFFQNLRLVEKKIIESELKGRPPEREKVVVEAPAPPEKKEKQLEYFLLGLSPSTIQNKLGAKLTRQLAKYRTRKAKYEKRQLEWEKFNALKPVEGINHPDDIALLNQAIETIGNYKLKSALDYKVPPHLRESKVKKYKQLLLIRQKAHDIRYVFNLEMYKFRDRKVELNSRMVELHAELKLVQKEIPDEQHKFGPPIPEITESHFPEKSIEVVVALPPKYCEKPKEPDPLITQMPTGDLLEKEILPYVDVDIYEETLETPWEMELRTIRLERKLFAQNEIIKEMNNLISSFDNDLQDLWYRRLQLLVDAICLDMHLMVLHQELIVLKNFEAHEESLSNAVNDNTLQCLDMQDIIVDINNKIDNHKATIEVLAEKEKDIQQQFYGAILDNKFYDFLRRIFKKKYKPPKEHKPDDSESDSESSESSDESEEEDAGSVDSRDFGIIKLDDSICPKGCDRRLYDLSFSLRTQRHAVEQETRDHKISIETLKKDLETNTKKTKLLETNLIRSQEELEAFQREKQRKLNEVNSMVIIKMNQLQHILPDYELCKISDTLLFSKMTISKLYRRVGQLQTETLEQKAKHKVNLIHLQRMRTDCKHMAWSIEQLKDKVKETMMIKFGNLIDVDELEEVNLRCFVTNLRMSQIDIKSLYESETQHWIKVYGEKQIELAETIRQNTSNLDLLILMTKERTEIIQSVDTQQRKKQNFSKIIDIAQSGKEDIKKLFLIIKNQKKHLQDLKDEIKTLRTKGMPVKALMEKQLFKEPKKDDEELEERSLEWVSYDDFVQKEYQLPEESKEMKLYKISKGTSITSRKSEYIVKDILLEMLESLGTEKPIDMSKFIIEELIEGIMNRSSVTAIIDDLLSLLPFEPSDQQTSIIEVTAEKIYSVQPEVTKQDLKKCACELIDEVIDDVLLSFGEPHEVIAKMIATLVQQIPIDYLMKRSSLLHIIDKIRTSLPEIEKETLVESVLSINSTQLEEMKRLLNRILEEVFGTGIDYIYVIPHV